MNTQDETRIEKALKQLIQYLSQKGVANPLAIIDKDGNEERVSLTPITNSAELKAWRAQMSSFTDGIISKLITTELSDITYIVNLNKNHRLMNIHRAYPDGSGELIYKFTMKQDGDIVTSLGHEIATSHIRLQHHLTTSV